MYRQWFYFSFFLPSCDLANFDRPFFRGGFVRRGDDAVSGEAVGEARERHVLAGVEGVEERLELRLVRVIAHVAAIEHFHRELAPRVPVETGEFLRMKFVVEDRAFAADEVRM